MADSNIGSKSKLTLLFKGAIYLLEVRNDDCFSLKEIESFQLPYQRQQLPLEKDKNYLDKENIKINLKFPQNGHYPSPIRVRSSRSIEREVFRKELELDELFFQDHKRKIREISQRK